jgi:hypothetical protein
MTSQLTKVKMPRAPSVVGDRVLVKNAYLVEFASDSGVKDHFETIAQSLKASHGIPKSAIKPRRIIRSSLFSGASFSLTANHPIEAVEMIEGAIAIYPIYTIPAPRPLTVSMDADVSYDNTTDLINSHDLTGVTQVHQQLQNFGAGVRVRKRQTYTLFLVFSIQKTDEKIFLCLCFYNLSIILYILKRSNQRFFVYYVLMSQNRDYPFSKLHIQYEVEKLVHEMFSEVVLRFSKSKCWVLQ